MVVKTSFYRGGIDMFKMYLYEVSADNGSTWTTQWLTENEAMEHDKMGYIVKQKDKQLFYKEI
jgi:hypothetical protein